MTYQLFNDETGQILEVRKKKIKRTAPFFMINQDAAIAFAKEKDLHGTEFRVLLYLLGKMNYENITSISQVSIAEGLEMPRPMVSKAIKKLIRVNVIKAKKVNGQSAYEINPDLATRGTLKG